MAVLEGGYEEQAQGCSGVEYGAVSDGMGRVGRQSDPHTLIPPTQADWVAWKAGAWKTVKHEAHHYWVGTKLLWLDMKIASRLAVKAGRGLELTRCGAEMHCTRGGGG